MTYLTSIISGGKSMVIAPPNSGTCFILGVVVVDVVVGRMAGAAMV